MVNEDTEELSVEDQELTEESQEAFALEKQFLLDEQEHKKRATEILKETTSYEDLIEKEIRDQEGEAMAVQTIGSMGLLMTKTSAWIEPVTVLDDKKLVANIDGKKEFAMFDDPLTVYMNMRNHWGVHGIIGSIKFRIALLWLRILGMQHYGLLKFNLYGIRTDGEYTIDLTKDVTPLKAQRRVEEFLKIANPAAQGQALAHMLQGLGSPAKWWVTGQWLITILLIVGMFLFVMNGGTI